MPNVTRPFSRTSMLAVAAMMVMIPAISAPSAFAAGADGQQPKAVIGDAREGATKSTTLTIFRTDVSKDAIWPALVGSRVTHDIPGAILIQGIDQNQAMQAVAKLGSIRNVRSATFSSASDVSGIMTAGGTTIHVLPTYTTEAVHLRYSIGPSPEQQGINGAILRSTSGEVVIPAGTSLVTVDWQNGATEVMMATPAI